MSSQRVRIVGVFTGQSADVIFGKISDISTFPSLMEVVIATQVEHEHGNERVAAWEVRLRGSILRWRERARIDRSSHSISFAQIDGDLDLFVGEWRVHESQSTSSGFTEVHIEVTFSIGIPMLAAMLEPIAIEALETNLDSMLRSLGAEDTVVQRDEEAAL